jgi:hypothetical protein
VGFDFRRSMNGGSEKVGEAMKASPTSKTV